jgi:type IVB pilus formation R64 PilN family outer membrane protein
MSYNLHKTKLLLAVAVASATTGCTIVDTSYDSVRNDMNNTRGEIRRNEAIKHSSVQEVDDIWLGGESFRVSEVSQAPSLLKRMVKIQQIEPISASDLISDLSRDLGIRIVLTQDAIEYTEGIESDDQDDDDDDDDAIPMGAVNGSMVGGQLSATPAQNIKFTIDYAGEVAGLLDIIATKSGLFWKFEHGEITMRRYETKSYLVDITPGKVEFESTMKSDLSSIGSGSGEEGALSSTDSYHQVRSTVAPKSNWEAMEGAVNSMLSKGGRIAISEQVGTVTVTDTPQVQRRVAEYIKRLNAISSKQIAIKAEVLEISSDENGNFDTGIMGAFDWKGDLALSVDGSQKLTFGVGSGGTNRAMENKWSSDSAATLDLLRQNKNVSLVTSSMIYAMNGQPTPFQQLDEVGYLAEAELSESTSEDAAPSMTLRPGRTSQGFSMMMMPRIMSDGRVMMNFAIDSSRINGIDSYGIDGGAQIQLPNRSLNKYQQMVSVSSGKPLMIAGLERTESHAQINSKFGRASWMLGGSQKGGKRKVMTMIILTPYVMAK